MPTNREAHEQAAGMGLCNEFFATSKIDPDAEFMPNERKTAELVARITKYLSNGGLFNPEMMEHNKVRDLLMDCRECIEEAILNLKDKQ